MAKTAAIQGSKALYNKYKKETEYLIPGLDAQGKEALEPITQEAAAAFALQKTGEEGGDAAMVAVKIVDLTGIASVVDAFNKKTCADLLPGPFPLLAELGVIKADVADTASGLCSVTGLIKNGGWGHLGTLPENCRPSKKLIFNLNNDDKTARVDVETNGKITWIAGGKSGTWISLSGITFLPAKVQQSPLPLANKWESYGGDYGVATVAVSKGSCSVEGLIKGGGWGHLATLPENCRPSKTLIFNLNNRQYTARVDVETNGEITWKAGGKSHGWISLTGIVFAPGSAREEPLPLANKWVSYGGGYGAATVARESGVCSVQGLIKNGGWGHLATLPENCRPSKRLIFNMNNHQYTARVDVETNGKITWIRGGKSHRWISLTGIVFSPGSAREEPLPLGNKWVSYGGTYGVATVARESGFCSVQGLIKNGGWGHLATLPENCRPSKRLIFNLNNDDKTARVDVETNGKITWIAGGKSGIWISLTGITFLPAKLQQSPLPLANKWESYGGTYGVATVA